MEATEVKPRKSKRPIGIKNSPDAEKTGPKLEILERENLKARVLQLALRDFTQNQIVEMTGNRISQSQVSKWIKEQREDWAGRSLAAREQLVIQKLAQFEEIRREAWAEWERSKTDIERKVSANGAKGETDWFKEEVITEGRLAAKAFLDVVLDTYRQERAMLGLDPEQKQGGVNVRVGLSWQNILVEAAVASDPVAMLEERINALTPEEVKGLPPITPEEVLAEEMMK